MKQNTELDKMKNWARILDVVVRVVGILAQIVCGISAVLFLAMNLFSIVPNEKVSMDLRIFGHSIQYDSISSTGQVLITILMAVICILALFMIRDLSKALHNVFEPMSNGRPFEDTAVKGFRRAAIWSLIIAVLALNGTVLIVAALLLLLSYIFHYGAILQTESDETL